jgi:hypothetical protein
MSTDIASGAGRTARAPSTEGAIEFLRDFLGENAPWPLVVIKKVDGKTDIKAATFDAAPKREDGADSWIRRWNDKGYNIYFAINRLRMSLNRKASKADVVATEWLWIDLDPREDADPRTEQAALDRALTADRPAEIPVPTWEIDSGRGRWGFWRLREPVSVDGKDGASTRRVEAHGRGIEKAFGKDFADDCRNIDRIARLPGTVNHKTGRCARVIAHRPEAVYDLADFPFADEAAERTAAKRTPARAKAKHTSDRASAARSAAGDEIERVIVEGCGDLFSGDRSKAVWHVCCELLRRGRSQATITATLLDRANGISAHVYDQAKPAEYAERQVARAVDEVTLTVSDNGQAHKTQSNVRVALLKLRVALRHDTFADRTLIDGLPGFGPTLDDAAVDRLWLQAEQRFRLSMPKEKFHTIIADTARLNAFHPVRDYLAGLKWDQKPRLDSWC